MYRRNSFKTNLQTLVLYFTFNKFSFEHLLCTGSHCALGRETWPRQMLCIPALKLPSFQQGSQMQMFNQN